MARPPQIPHSTGPGPGMSGPVTPARAATPEHGGHGTSGQHVYRNMPPYGQAPEPYRMGHGDLFRHALPGAGWSDTVALGGQDPRLTPSGDVARRGTIPAYVPFAVLNPGKIVNIPQ